MSIKPRQILIRFFLPIVWRFFPERRAYYLQDFELAELDSCWQILHALPYAQADLKSKLFFHAVEELDHYQTFSELKNSFAQAHLKRPILKRKSLLPSFDQIGLIKFLAYVYVGEKEVNSDFLVYAKSFQQEPVISQAYLKIKDDESGHEEKTRRWLDQAAKNHKLNLKSTLFIFSMKRSFDTYKKLMNMIGNIPLSVLLGVIYFITAPIALIQARKRMTLTRSEELAIFKEQLSKFEIKS